MLIILRVRQSLAVDVGGHGLDERAGGGCAAGRAGPVAAVPVIYYDIL